MSDSDKSDNSDSEVEVCTYCGDELPSRGVKKNRDGKFCNKRCLSKFQEEIEEKEGSGSESDSSTISRVSRVSEPSSPRSDEEENEDSD